MRIRNLPAACRYASADRCIYCGDTKPPLTLEHIIPYALEGDLELPNASCESCRLVTSAAEQNCLRGMLIAPRTRLNVRTRNPKNRPSTLKLGEFDRADDGSPPPDMQAANFRWKELPVSEHPTAVILPRMPPPGIFTGRKGAGDFPILSIDFYPLRLPQPAPEGREQAVLAPFRPDAFARMLAKIAHGLAYAEFGPDAFVPLLPDYILGRRSDYGNVIGTGNVGRLARDRLVFASLHFDQGYFVAQIQLFARHGFRPYRVVAGSPTERDRYFSPRLEGKTGD